MTAELKAMGMNVKEYTFVDTNDVNSVTQSIVNDKCDAVFVPTDNTASSNTEAINNVLEPAKIPVIAGEAGICSGCGIATLSISYYDLGYITGEMAYEILVNGKDPAEMDIQFADAPEKMYLKSRADALGITVPEGYGPLEEA